ncbi:MAG TPA: SAM-dependent methyltransferase [Actinospica sp.]|jgi:tRNA-Thr(GGU) m(6)t(6)A37 methyltransferase TsaA|nr:SAM-dependent methyltransferase [Actinospica sp.]
MSTGIRIELEPVAHVVGGRVEPTDDYWGGTTSIIRVDADRFPVASVTNLDSFSHIQVIFYFHKQDLDDLNLGARRPRNNPEWPEVGTFGHRNMKRVNRIGASTVRLLKIDGLDLHVEELDAIDGTPVLDIKPYFQEFGPRGEVVQPAWVSEMLADYFALPDN